VVPALFATAVASISPPADADDGELHASLVYRVDSSLSGCWEETEFRRRISRRTGYDPFHDDAPVSVIVNVTGSTNAIGGRVEWRDAKAGGMGERRFVAKDGNCGKLLAEMSFAIALQIEMLRPAPKPEPARPGSATPSIDTDSQTQASSTVAADTPSPTPSKAQTAPSEPAPLASRPEPRTEAEEEDREVSAQTGQSPAQWSLSAGLGPSIAWGMSPSATADLRLFIALRRNDLSLELAAGGSYPSEEVGWRGFGFRSTWLGGTAALCGHASALSACALGKVGQLRIEGLSVDRPEQPSGFVAHTGLRVGATTELGKGWFFTARLDGLLLLTPHTVEMNDVELWRMPRWSALAGIDVGLRLR
jgi:hypothetical protein